MRHLLELHESGDASFAAYLLPFYYKLEVFVLVMLQIYLLVEVQAEYLFPSFRLSTYVLSKLVIEQLPQFLLLCLRQITPATSR